MNSPVNRTAIFLNIAAFCGMALFCVFTQAPLIQQDILRRCENALLARQIPSDGLSVAGRDVTVTGLADNLIVSARARTILSRVSGVRQVVVKVSDRRASSSNSRDLEPAGSAQQRDLQDKLDRLLDNQGITFTGSGTVLSSESEIVMDKVAAYLTEFSTMQCEIRGYDDHSDGSQQNLKLGLERALSAEDYLVNKGIAEWRLSTHAFRSGEGAESRPHGRALDFVVRAR